MSIKVIELFAGIGSQHQALLNIGVPHKVVAISEIDKYCLKSYEALHGSINNLGDICKIEKLPQVDLWTYSFPCQDISLAGKLAGIREGTRSGLLKEVERLLNVANDEGTLPKYLLLENVKNLVSKRFINDFTKWLDFLTSLGYTNYYQVLNAKDYGIPQNRERVFCVSIRGEHKPFKFPQKQELKLRLKDMLEDEVDEKYYLSDKIIKFFEENSKIKGNGFRFKPHDENSKYAYAITTRAGGRMDDNFIIIPEKTKKGYAEASEGDGVYINRPHQKRGVVQKGMIQTIKTNCNDIGVVVKGNLKNEMCNKLIKEGKVKEFDVIRHSYTRSRMNGKMKDIQENNISPTLDTRCDCLGVVVKGNYSPSGHNASRIVDINGLAPTVMENHGTVTAIEEKLRIRKLTPKECWRLMGWTDEDFEKASKVNSNAQLYKQAGNGIVVQVLEAIFKQMFLSNIE